jgi:hypothetical protein
MAETDQVTASPGTGIHPGPGDESGLFRAT